jgi:hypothetical protein
MKKERVEYNVFLCDEPLKGSKSQKIFKISLTFRFDKLSNLSKSVHTGENSQILTVSNKKQYTHGNGFYWLQKVTGSPSALQSYPSVASKNPFYHASNVKYYFVKVFKYRRENICLKLTRTVCCFYS